jgi:hypothetical protein
MYYEHKARDPEQARQIVRQALDELRRANQVGDIALGPYREIKARFDHGMTRLERKRQGIFYKVQANDGNIYIIRQQTSTPDGTWDLVSFRRTDQER